MNTGKQWQKEIKEGRNLESILPLFFNECSSDYYVSAGMQFIIQYYNLFEALMDGDKKANENSSKYLRKICDIVNEQLFTPFDGTNREKGMKQLDMLRCNMISIMKNLTYYADQFLIYEYIFLRIKKNYEDHIAIINDDTAISNIVKYIFSSKDNAVINQKIKDVIYLLPVRMTKNRFLDLISDSLVKYIGANQQAVDDYLYMIRSVAGLYKDDMGELENENSNEKTSNKEKIENKNNTVKTDSKDSKEFGDVLLQLKSVDFRDLSKDDYEKLSNDLLNITTKIKAETDFYYNLQEVVNYLYALLLNIPYASRKAVKIVDKLFPLLQAVNEKMEAFLENGSKNRISNEIVELFESTEGKLEEYVEQLLVWQGILADVEADHKEIVHSFMLHQELNCLLLSEKLMSDSLFIEIDRKPKMELATKEYVREKTDEIISEFTGFFKGQQQIVNRAIMASVLKELPVFFEDATDVKNYVKTAIANCHDMAERAGCMSEIYDLIADESCNYQIT